MQITFPFTDSSNQFKDVSLDLLNSVSFGVRLIASYLSRTVSWFVLWFVWFDCWNGVRLRIIVVDLWFVDLCCVPLTLSGSDLLQLRDLDDLLCVCRHCFRVLFCYLALLFDLYLGESMFTFFLIVLPFLDYKIIR